jgi:hypothetical protein
MLAMICGVTLARSTVTQGRENVAFDHRLQRHAALDLANPEMAWSGFGDLVAALR